MSKYFLTTVILLGLIYQNQAKSAIPLTMDDYNNIPTAANLRALDARGPNRYQYSLNLLVALNSSLSISTLNQSNPIYWALTRYTNNTFYLEQQNQLADRQAIRVTLFNLVDMGNRNSTIKSQFICSPSDVECKQITVPKFELTYLGMYSYQSQINGLDSLFVDYNVSTYINHIQMECSEPQFCLFNSSTQTMSVLAGQSVQITCSILIAQNSVYDPAAEITMDECQSRTEIEQLPLSAVADYMNITTDNVNIVLYKLSKKCERRFEKEHLGKGFSCDLRSVNQSVPAGLQKLGVYETLASKLDVQSEPSISKQVAFNKTLIAGQAVNTRFECPFTSNPVPIFEWRLLTVYYNNTPAQEASAKRRLLTPNDFTQAEREYQIPQDLEIGLYVFECRARTLGLVNKVSDSLRFYLNVIPTPVNTKKGQSNNAGAIIGGTIGGIVAIILIAVLVLFLFRRKMTKKEDNNEKAKELDIDINDGNPHLSSRSNLSQPIHPGNNNNTVQSKPNTKHIPGLMVTSTTAQSYAAIAHAAAAAAQSNQQRNQPQQDSNSQSNLFSSNSSNNLLNSSKSYNNPGFFESTSYPIQNPLESPPPYDAALQQPVKKESPKNLNQQLMHKDFMGSNSRLLPPGSNTPQAQKASSLSYTAQGNLALVNSTPNSHNMHANSLQHLGYQTQPQPNLQYTTVQNMARNRNPLMDQMDSQQQSTQYTTMAQLNPIDV